MNVAAPIAYLSFLQREKSEQNRYVAEETSKENSLLSFVLVYPYNSFLIIC